MFSLDLFSVKWINESMNEFFHTNSFLTQCSNFDIGHAYFSKDMEWIFRNDIDTSELVMNKCSIDVFLLSGFFGITIRIKREQEWETNEMVNIKIAFTLMNLIFGCYFIDHCDIFYFRIK